ncbi:MAG: AAA family ATPase [Pseudomonadota bacterium]
MSDNKLCLFRDLSRNKNVIDSCTKPITKKRREFFKFKNQVDEKFWKGKHKNNKDSELLKMLCKRLYNSTNCVISYSNDWWRLVNESQISVKPTNKFANVADTNILGQFERIREIHLNYIRTSDREKRYQAMRKATRILSKVLRKTRGGDKGRKEIKTSYDAILIDLSKLARSITTKATQDKLKATQMMLMTFIRIFPKKKELNYMARYKSQKIARVISEMRSEMVLSYEKTIVNIDKTYQLHNGGKSCGLVPPNPYLNSCNLNAVDQSRAHNSRWFLPEKFKLNVRKYVYVGLAEIVKKPMEKGSRATETAFLPFNKISTLKLTQSDIDNSAKYTPITISATDNRKGMYYNLNSILRVQRRESKTTSRMVEKSALEMNGYKKIAYVQKSLDTGLPRVFAYKKRYPWSLGAALYNTYDPRIHNLVRPTSISLSPYEAAAIYRMRSSMQVGFRNMALGESTFDPDTANFNKKVRYFFPHSVHEVMKLAKRIGGRKGILAALKVYKVFEFLGLSERISQNKAKLAEAYVKIIEEHTGKTFPANARAKMISEAKNRFEAISNDLWDRGDLEDRRFGISMQWLGLSASFGFLVYVAGIPLSKKVWNYFFNKPAKQINKEMDGKYKANKLDTPEGFKNTGRESELRNLTEFLRNPDKQHIIATGWTGSGKDFAIEYLLQMIAKGDERIPVDFRKAKIYRIDAASFQAGTEYRGAVASKIEAIKKLAKGGEKVVVYMPEIDKILTAGGTSSGNAEQVAGLLLDVMENNKNIVFIGTTSRKTILTEACPDLQRRANWQHINALPVEDVVRILQNQKSFKEQCKNVYGFDYSDKQLDEQVKLVARLTEKYVRDFGKLDNAAPRFNAVRDTFFTALSIARSRHQKSGEDKSLWKLELKDIVEAVNTQAKNLRTGWSEKNAVNEDKAKEVINTKEWNKEIDKEGVTANIMSELRSVVGENSAPLLARVANEVLKSEIVKMNRPVEANWVAMKLLKRWYEMSQLERSIAWTSFDNFNPQIGQVQPDSNVPSPTFIRENAAKMARELIAQDIIKEDAMETTAKTTSSIQQIQSQQSSTVVNVDVIKLRGRVTQMLKNAGITHPAEVEITNWSEYAREFLKPKDMKNGEVSEAFYTAVENEILKTHAKGKTVFKHEGTWYPGERNKVISALQNGTARRTEQDSNGPKNARRKVRENRDDLPRQRTKHTPANKRSTARRSALERAEALLQSQKQAPKEALTADVLNRYLMAASRNEFGSLRLEVKRSIIADLKANIEQGRAADASARASLASRVWAEELKRRNSPSRRREVRRAEERTPEQRVRRAERLLKMMRMGK